MSMNKNTFIYLTVFLAFVGITLLIHRSFSDDADDNLDTVASEHMFTGLHPATARSITAHADCVTFYRTGGWHTLLIPGRSQGEWGQVKTAISALGVTTATCASDGGGMTCVTTQDSEGGENTTCTGGDCVTTYGSDGDAHTTCPGDELNGNDASSSDGGGGAS